VGNSAAAFVLQRLGHDALTVDTVRWSNHPGRGVRPRGRITGPSEIDTLVAGLAAMGALGDVGAVLSGYLGRADQGPAILRAVRRVKSANRDAFWLLDPVIGDRGRVFVAPGVAEFIRDEAAPRADALTPNHFELEFLTGRKVRTLSDARRAIDRLAAAPRGRGPRLVAATGLRLETAPRKTLATIACDGTATWRVVAPEVAHPAYGAGDVFAALFLGWYVRTRNAAGSLELAASALDAIIRRTAAAGALELAIVAAQDELTAPTTLLRAERLD
jgi:pyridoxine kinase